MSGDIEDIKFIQRKGGTILICNGHQYYKLKLYKNGSVIWRCASYFTKDKCSGSLTLQGNCVIRKMGHLCKPDFEKNKIAMSIAELKDTVTKSDKPITKLYNRTLKRFVLEEGNNSARNFPSFTNIQHSLYDVRNKTSAVMKTVFNKSEEVQVPKNFYNMVLADYCFEGDRILLFCTSEAREVIPNITEFFIDATFKACPPPFKELVSIHGDIGSTATTTKVVPIIFGLLCYKTQIAYEKMYDMIQSQLPQFKPEIFHCDFEVANINALLLKFPSIKIVGCYFHWQRCVWRKAEALVGKSRCKAENRILSLCAVLPLLPSEMLLEGWAYIKTESEYLPTLDKFIKYIQRMWIREKYLNLLSVFGMRHRTNNVLEGYHSKLNKYVNKNNKTLMRLLNVIKDDSFIKIVAKQFNLRRKRIILNDDNIQNILMQLINKEISIGYALEKLR